MDAATIWFVLRQMRILITLCVLSAGALAPPPQIINTAVGTLFRNHKGTAVVVDVKSGRVLASYDLDRASRRVVRPGSAVKPFVLAALIDAGALQNDPGVRCNRTLTIADRKLNCGHPQNGVELHAVEALAYSCNTYFTEMAKRLTGIQLQQALLQWGLASRTGSKSDSVPGRITLAATKEQVQLQAIGEDNILVTPLGLLTAYRKLALERLKNGDGFRTHRQVHAGLDAATNYGMSRLAQPANVRIAGKPLRVAGKTGTSMAAEGPWTHGWFAGFAPSDDPQIAVVVFVEHGTGPTDAAPIASEIFSSWAREAHE